MANQAWPLRPSDGLLERKELQEVVAAQSRRDAAALGVFFEDEDPLVRARAAFAAGSVQDPSLTAGLLKLLKDSDVRVRVDAAFALRQTPGAPSTRLCNSLQVKNHREVRSILIKALRF